MKTFLDTRLEYDLVIRQHRLGRRRKLAAWHEIRFDRVSTRHRL